jgi:hypothetical protein
VYSAQTYCSAISDVNKKAVEILQLVVQRVPEYNIASRIHTEHVSVRRRVLKPEPQPLRKVIKKRDTVRCSLDARTDLVSHTVGGEDIGT